MKLLNYLNHGKVGRWAAMALGSMVAIVGSGAAYGNQSEGLIETEWFNEPVSTYADNEDLTQRGYVLPASGTVRIRRDGNGNAYLDAEDINVDAEDINVGDRLAYVPETEGRTSVVTRIVVRVRVRAEDGDLPPLHGDEQANITLANMDGQFVWIGLTGNGRTNLYAEGWTPVDNEWYDVAIELDNRNDVERRVRYSAKRIKDSEYTILKNGDESWFPNGNSQTARKVSSLAFGGEFSIGDFGGIEIEEVSDIILAFSDNGDGTTSITGYSGIAPSSLAIPETHDGKLVTGIGASAFQNCSGLAEVTIPFSVTNIGERAFANCAGLTHVEAPRRLKDMIESRNVFANCPANLEIEYVAAQIRNVTAKQRFPWNGLVDITCKVSGISETGQWKFFAIEAVIPDAGAVREVSQFWGVKNGVNSTDKKVQANGTYKLLWDAQADLGQVVYSNIVMRVTLIDHDKVQLWEGGPYWATTNIGAENPEDYGYYFWWGDTVGYKRENNAWVASDGSSSNFSFNSGNAPTCGKDNSALLSAGYIDSTGNLVLEHDAAHVHWGGEWRMPTDAEFAALINKCTTTWITTNGVYGRLVTGKGAYANRSIFLPAAGNGVSYWSSTSFSFYSSLSGYSYDACLLCFGSSYFYRSYDDRYFGRSVRPVRGFAQ